MITTDIPGIPSEAELTRLANLYLENEFVQVPAQTPDPYGFTAADVRNVSSQTPSYSPAVLSQTEASQIREISVNTYGPSENVTNSTSAGTAGKAGVGGQKPGGDVGGLQLPAPRLSNRSDRTSRSWRRPSITIRSSGWTTVPRLRDREQ